MAGTSVLEQLAERIRAALPPGIAVAEKRMFGGIGFLIDGNLMCCATRAGRVLLRVGAAAEPAVLAEGGAEPFINGTRRMTGYVMIDADAVAEDDALARRLLPGVAFTAALPAKSGTTETDAPTERPVRSPRRRRSPPAG